jgi:hypothetical protein
MNSFPSWLQANSLTWYELLSVRTILCERGSMKLSSSQVDPTQSTLPVGCHATHRLLPGVCTVPVALHCLVSQSRTERSAVALASTSFEAGCHASVSTALVWPLSTVSSLRPSFDCIASHTRTLQSLPPPPLANFRPSYENSTACTRAVCPESSWVNSAPQGAPVQPPPMGRRDWLLTGERRTP